MALRLITCTSAAARLDAVAQFLRSHPPATEILVVAASRGAADDIVRHVARTFGATFGLTRFGFTELASRLAATSLAEAHRAPVSQIGAQAAATRAVFDAVTAGELHYFGPVAELPGFPTALARTLHELRLAGIGAGRLQHGVPAARDLGRLLERVEEQFARSAVVDRAMLFDMATRACRRTGGTSRFVGVPIVMLDIPLNSRAESEFARAIIDRSPNAMATVPDGDDRTLAAFGTADTSVVSGERTGPSSPSTSTQAELFRRPSASSGVVIEELDDPAHADSDLLRLRRYIFSNERPAARRPAGDVRLYSAPGEGREAMEIVRRVLDEAARGVPFDEMAVFLRAPQQYLGLLDHACARGDVPVYFDRGTRRPDPAGRAFLALLSCAADGLSAKRFDEYLSLGQVPLVGESTAHEARLAEPVPPDDEMFGARFEIASDDGGSATEEEEEEHPDSTPAVPSIPPPDSDDEAIIAGTLRAPWKWEELIVESSVVAGRTRADGRARWRRRLDGLAADFGYRIEELRKEEPESPLIKRLERDQRNLFHLRQFALPIIDMLADWPDWASWAEWLERFNALAARALKRPMRVQQVLAELRPLTGVTDVDLEEARRVLHDRLASLDWKPPARRYGRLFVGTPHQARGRQFRVVFFPGLAERVVPQRPREDPLLLDDSRIDLAGGLIRQDERASAERLLLKIAIGSATERLYLSYPRLDSTAEGRARVPSFYALDVMRAITGSVPDYRVLAQQAAEEAGASLAWPAPLDPDRAVDDLEHDLAVLKPLLDSRDISAVKGRAHYMLGLNPALHRLISSRWLRDRKAWSKSDGLLVTAGTLAPHLTKHRLDVRPYSLSALQRFAVCPYQFLLATIHRLEPWTEPEPLVRMDPLTRGSVFHKVQAEFQREMQERNALPVTPQSVNEAAAILEEVLSRVAKDYEETLAPAIERVWRDEVDDLRRDLSIWVQRMAEEREWIPEYFEFSFGLHDEGRDPRSLVDPVVIDGRFKLRGSVDLIERHSQLDVLRVTDHKTGKNRSNPDLIVGGGTMLQPVLYSMAVEQGLARRVVAGRLYYSTTAGGFADQPVELNDYARGQALQVLTIIDRAVEQGVLVAAPAERACTWCDFRPVCGPREQERVKRKAADRLADLDVLRSMR